MGLPLFIAPVESDLPSKAAEKNSATSPPRSAIRRNVRIERRASHRRIFSIRDRLAADGSLQQSSTLTGRDGRTVPWSEAGFPPELESIRAPDGTRRARPFRDVLREMTRTDDRRRELLQDGIDAIFRDGSNSQDRNTSNSLPYDELEYGWWAAEAPPRPPRAPMAAPVAPSQVPEGDGAQFPAVARRTLQNSTSDAEGVIQRRPQRWGLREAYRMSSNNRHPRHTNAQRSRGVDGLGDRDRSLSPEVWDTLLSTLTPDPQPPSAGSSFASNVASQSAGATTTSTSFTAPDPDPDTMVDQACESGCEGSETEGPDHALSVLDRIRRRRAEARRVRLRAPYAGSVAVPRDLSRRRSPDGGPVSNGARDMGSVGSTRERFFRSHSAWVGHMSVGNSDDEQGPERSRQNRESSAASGSNANAEDDWMGMQRIVRSLARREDIPDEWWAEAGLSRTLPGEGTE